MPISLTHTQLNAMHEASSLESYQNWRSAAPHSWKQDRWFMTRVPIIIASRHGQNEALAFTEEKAMHFHSQLRWEDMRWISFALAAQFEYAAKLINHA